jgi:S-adenosyl-L-methionine hydrolase (adenosine-forming)
MPVITLTTDFGVKDGFVGTMKGVIWQICPEAKIADISHDIIPQSVVEGAYALWRAYPYFPPGTIHIAVVDPGVGTSRRPIVVQSGSQFFVAPDNGLLTPIFKDAAKKSQPLEIIHAINQAYWLPVISHTFHGRDIFSPIGAHLACGVALAVFGPAIKDVVHLDMPEPEKTRNGWLAHITVIDVFGNLTTDLPFEQIHGIEKITFHIYDQKIKGLTQSYGYAKPGELIALVDSENFIEIAMVNGSAARSLGAKFADIVEVIIE